MIVKTRDEWRGWAVIVKSVRGSDLVAYHATNIRGNGFFQTRHDARAAAQDMRHRSGLRCRVVRARVVFQTEP